MTVEKQELKALHKSVLKNIASLKLQSKPDSAKLFDLNILDSNISLLLSSVARGENEVELGSRDTQIKEALREFRREEKLKNAPSAVAAKASACAQEAVAMLCQQKEKICAMQEKILSHNIQLRYDQAIAVLKEVAELVQTKQRALAWTKKEVPLPLQNAGAILGSAKSEKKAASSRENGKLGGRPRKSPAKTAKSTKPQKTAKSGSAPKKQK